ncbi:MAG: S-methyl-5'-thioadenosine phosphorylase [Candidatus Thorarchaeota archaeon]
MKNENQNFEIGILGGTGSDLTLNNSKTIKVFTPYGNTSSIISIGDLKGKKVAFIPRHGPNHNIPPHKVNFRANIWALKELGVRFLISPSAVGSLKKEYNKGKFILVDQYIDRTKKRDDSFYDGGQLCHISQASPYCGYLNDLFYQIGKTINLDIKKGGTYVCIEGPRFSTRAESKMFRKWEGDVIGMTTYPEVVLAAEKEICYCCIAMVTDLDVWAAECPKCGIVEFAKNCEKCGSVIKELSVNVPEVLETMNQNALNLRKLLEWTIEKLDIKHDCSCHHTLKTALL